MILSTIGKNPLKTQLTDGSPLEIFKMLALIFLLNTDFACHLYRCRLSFPYYQKRIIQGKTFIMYEDVICHHALHIVRGHLSNAHLCLILPIQTGVGFVHPSTHYGSVGYVHPSTHYGSVGYVHPSTH